MQASLLTRCPQVLAFTGGASLAFRWCRLVFGDGLLRPRLVPFAGSALALQANQRLSQTEPPHHTEASPPKLKRRQRTVVGTALGRRGKRRRLRLHACPRTFALAAVLAEHGEVPVALLGVLASPPPLLLACFCRSLKPSRPLTPSPVRMSPVPSHSSFIAYSTERRHPAAAQCQIISVPQTI